MMKKYDLIIIGGGFSGLGCARSLFKNNKDFLMITDNLGGRVLTSKDGKVNYGAYYVGGDFKNVLLFVKKGKKIKRLDLEFNKRGCSYTLWDMKLFKHPIEVLRLFFLLVYFRFKYNKFKKKCEFVSQKEVIENYKYFKKLYFQSAKDFVKEKKIECLTKNYLIEILRGTTLSNLNNVNAFGFLWFLLPFIVNIYEFKFDDKIFFKFRKKIVFDKVVKIKKLKEGYEVKTKKRQYLTRNLVVATPPWVSKKLLGLKRMNKVVKAHMFHIKGELSDECYDCGPKLFGVKSSVLAIAYQSDGTYLFYSKKDNPDFKKYFRNYKIIAKKFWNPAFVANGKVLWKSNLSNGLYLIGDHNINGLEDSYITGIYAANKIIESKLS